ncbi:MAG TPA: hypothetical protein DEA44_07165 [Firmicutes bacterium]|nr:hypothetical protein [Bacillota bacterium]
MNVIAVGKETATVAYATAIAIPAGWPADRSGFIAVLTERMKLFNRQRTSPPQVFRGGGSSSVI